MLLLEGTVFSIMAKVTLRLRSNILYYAALSVEYLHFVYITT
jgi:hypothetical protein